MHDVFHQRYDSLVTRLPERILLSKHPMRHQIPEQRTCQCCCCTYSCWMFSEPFKMHLYLNIVSMGTFTEAFTKSVFSLLKRMLLEKSLGAQQIETLLKRPLPLAQEASCLYQRASLRNRYVQTAYKVLQPFQHTLLAG